MIKIWKKTDTINWIKISKMIILIVYHTVCWLTTIYIIIPKLIFFYLKNYYIYELWKDESCIYTTELFHQGEKFWQALLPSGYWNERLAYGSHVPC